MAESTKPMKLGTKVEVVGKGVVGTVAYIGTTLFSTGKWIGVVLDEPKGKNDGTVQGKTYFTCPENHGIFVRQSQITAIDDDRSPTPGDEDESQPQTQAPPTPAPPTPAPPTPAATMTTATPAARSVRKSGLRPPSYSGKSTENLSEVAPTPKRATSIPKDLSEVGTSVTHQAASESGIPGPGSKLKRPTSKESLSLTKTPTTPQPLEAKTPKLVTTPTEVKRQSLSQASAADINAVNVSNVESKMLNLQQQQEIEGLKAEIKDLNEKLDTLKFKRAEDKVKLKEFEKTKIQLQQLQEYKTKMQETQGDLQRQLQTAKKEAREAQENYERYREEMSDLTETVEIATLDKEMAEEKCETLQQEVETLKEKIEELNVELEILKAEISEKGTDGVASDYQVKQLEQQNERLKEALVKMRDLANQDKHDKQQQSKQLEKLISESSLLKKDKERLQSEVEALQTEMIELKEQVDAALGAEQMVESLTERNLQLEEKIHEIEEEKADLEAMNEMNEELQENARETELELREEVDLANAKTIEAVRKLEATMESVADYEATIAKFRELVAHLQETVKELRSREIESGQKAETPQMEIFDFKTKFAETKAYAKTIDMELRKLDVQQANTHVSLLQSFMPDTFLNRGGDHDAVLVLLMVPRIISKAELLATQVRDKFEMVNNIDKETVLKSHKAEQCSFANHLILMLNILQGIMRQYESALKTCSVDLFLKIGTLLPEMAAHEKTVDYFIDLLRKDQLDESTSLDLLDKSLNFFTQLHSVHLVNETLDCTTFISDQVRLVVCASDCISTDISRLRVLLQPRQEKAEISILLRDLETCNNDTRLCARKIKRRLPQGDSSTTMTPLNFSKEVQDLILECCKNINRVAKTLQLVGIGAMQQAAILTDAEGLMAKKVEEISYQASDKVYGKEDTGPYECLRTSFGVVVGTMNKLASAMENGEYDFDGTSEKKPVPPVVMRAKAIKSQIADIENMKFKLESKEEDVKELKRQIKLKQEELSEQQIRIGLIEKKLENATKDSDEKVEKMQRKLEEAQNLLMKKEKEFEQTADALQADIDTLEREKSELRERLKVLSKKTLLEGISRQAGQSATSPVTGGLSPSSSFSVQDSPILLQQIELLKEALRFVKDDNIRLKAEKTKEIVDKLPPLRVPKKPTGLTSTTGHVTVGELPESVPGKVELSALARQTAQLLQEVNKLSACPKLVDISKRQSGTSPVYEKSNPARQLINTTANLTLLERKTQDLQVQVTMLLAANRTGGQVRTDFSTFPTPEFARVLHEKNRDSVKIGRVTVPATGTKGEMIPLNIQPHQLRHLHARLVS
ncbi:hypothetical protein CHS0354_041172 [Potamilus streckersoni]|uniref:Dynactin subunit 1 n=1 Tax=Potamilus streckersoni TaxID=2493646 RepID=A0AAE0SES2_9BIVA|nr:hypothetical protein CHS0354_041172 [Potamilus streckersoni]